MKYNYTQPANELQRFANMVEFPDAEPTENSAQLVTSGGVYDAIQAVEEEAKQLSYNSLMEDSVGPAAIVTFPDGAQGAPVAELTSSIEPIQDLHGYDNPWPDGGNVNLMDMSKVVLEPSTSMYGLTAVKDVNAGTIRIYGTPNYATSGFKPFTLFSYANLSSSGYSAKTFIVSKSSNVSSAPLRMDAPNNRVALDMSVTDVNDVDITLKGLFYVGTAPDTWSPYSNICPISGFTGAEISVTGINIWDEEWEQGGIDDTTGAKIPWGTQIRGKNYIPCKGSTNYYVEGPSGTVGVYIYYYDIAKNFVGRAIVGGAYSVVRKTITTPANAAFMMMKAGTLTTYGYNISINYPSTDHDYHSGTDNTTYSVSWSDHGTIYKGTAQYKGGGEWEITATYADVDLSTLTWNAVSNTRWVSGAISGIKMPLDNTTITTAISDSFKAYSNDGLISAEPAMGFAVDQNSCIRVRNGSTTIPPTGHVLYPLVTPVEFTISGPDPETLLGDNNIWSDTGDISVKYRCNTALYILKITGA